jgi:hypothetical protein
MLVGRSAPKCAGRKIDSACRSLTSNVAKTQRKREAGLSPTAIPDTPRDLAASAGWVIPRAPRAYQAAAKPERVASLVKPRSRAGWARSMSGQMTRIRDPRSSILVISHPAANDAVVLAYAASTCGDDCWMLCKQFAELGPRLGPAQWSTSCLVEPAV